jgi:hypothetical protein
MFAHRIETTIAQDGLLSLKTLPFHKGEEVEVIILRRDSKKQGTDDDLEAFFAKYQVDFSHFKFDRDEANAR